MKVTNSVEARSANLAVNAGQSYTLAFWYRCVSYTAGGWGGDRARVTNSDGTEAVAQENLHATCDTQWRQYKLSFVPSGSTVKVSLGVYGSSRNVELFFDDVRLSTDRLAQTGGTATPTAVATQPAGQTWTFYVYAGVERIAMKTAGGSPNFMLGDHLGSTVLVVNSSGGVVARKLYKAWGEERYASGSLGTKYEYTGQRSDNYVNLLWYNSRWYDPYITQFTQPDQIIPDPTNPLDFNRYSYVRYNPIRFNDPTGHYVCTGSNEKWGEKTCYDIVNNWLDYLYKQGGDEGKSLVEQFMKADAEYTIRIDFVDPGKMNGAMAQSVNLYNKVNVDINAGMNNDNIGYEAAALGHELVHLLRQSSVEQGTAKAEKEAYEVSEKLYKSMGLDPIPMVKALSPLGSSPEEMQKVAIYTNSNLKTPFLNYANPLARALAIVPWEFITNCYGNVCIIPGGQSYQYHSPTE